MADATRAVTLRVGLDFADANKAAAQIGQGVGSSLGEADDALKRTQKEADRLAEKYKKAMEEMERKATEASDATVRIGESTRTAADGVFKLGRGIAFLAAGSEEDFQKMLQTVAKVQGAFDLFRGSIDVIKGVYEATKALRIARQAMAAADAAATVAAGAHTTAVVAETEATVGATVATNAFTAALIANPVTAVLVGIAAAAAALFLIFKDDGSEANEILEEQNRLLEEEAKKLKEINRIRQEGAQRRADLIVGTTTRELSALDELGRSTEEQLAALDSAEQKRRQAFGEEQTQIRREFEPFGNDITLEQRNQQTLKLKQAELRLNEDLASIEEARVSVRERSLQQHEEEEQHLQEQLRLAQERVDAERERLDVAEELGRLTDVEFEELKALSERVRSGQELSREELQRLEQLGGSQVRGFVGQQFAQAGAERTGVLEPFTVEKTDAERALEEAKANVQDFKARMDQATADVIAANNEAWEGLLDTFKRIASLADAIEDFRQDVDLRNAQRGGGL